jgi:membrane-associated phospholipid phosphatase
VKNTQPPNADFFRNPAVIIVFIGCLIMTVVSYLFWDISLATYCRQLSPAVKKTAEVITAFGVSTWYIVASIILYLVFRFIHKNNLNAARSLFVSLSLCITGIFINILKWIAGRYRPIELFNNGNFGFGYFGIGYEWTSFPSGHAQTAFSLATALTILYPRWGIPLFVVAGAVGISRIILTSHYLSDVIAGAGIGILFTMAIKYYFDGRQIKLKEK